MSTATAAQLEELMLGQLPDLIARLRRALDPQEVTLANLPAGCTFAPRCGFATDECRAAYPPLKEQRPGHWVACWHAERLLGDAS